MSIVMFKLRVVNPRSRDAAQRNGAHLAYIGSRPGAVRNDGKLHGLFGRINGMDCEDADNMDDFKRYAETMTRNGTIMYRAIISLTEADAQRLGYADEDKWRELICEKIPDIAAKIGISASELEYAAVFHREQGHPHCHVIFWDKAQKVKKNPYVHWKVANDIRINLTKHIFADDMDVLKNAKNIARSETVKGLSVFFTDFLDGFADMTAQEMTEAEYRLKRDGEYAHGRLIYNHFKTADMRELAQDFLKIRDAIPPTGRLNYQFMPPATKSEIDGFIRKILSKNEDCGREFDRYVNSAEELCEFYTSDPKKHADARKNAEDEMMKRLGNAVLKTVKDFNGLERNKDFEAKQDMYRRQCVERLITEIFSILSQEIDAQNYSYHHAHSELSKQAKKELAIEMEDSSGFDWEG